MRLGLKEMDRAFNKTEDDIKALQSVGQIIGSVLKQLDEDRCKPAVSVFRRVAVVALHVSTNYLLTRFLLFVGDITTIVIIKAASGPRYVVGCRNKLDKSKLKLGTRVALDMTTFTIMRMLPREVDPMVYSMGMEDPGSISFAGIGGLSEQIRELREVTIVQQFFRIKDRTLLMTPNGSVLIHMCYARFSFDLRSLSSL